MGTWLLHENEHKTLQIIVNTVFPYQHQTSPNLHRHPKKTKKQNQSHKTLASTKKRKKNPSIYSGFWTPIGWKSLFFFCFFWCLPMFCEIVLCFFLLFLVPANVLRDQSHQTLTRKKTNTRCTKLWQALKKKYSIYSGFWTPIGWKSLFFFCFFWCLPMFCEIVLCFFCFFWCLPMSWEIKPPNIDKKKTTTRCTKLWQAPKNKIQHLLRILDPHRLEIFVFFWLFLVPANVLWGCALSFFWCLPLFFEHHYKTRCKNVRFA